MVKKENNDEIIIDKDKIKEYADKYGFFVGLLAVFGIALWLRTFPMKFEYLQAIDPFYLARMTETVINNNFHVPSLDPLRYFPTGFNTKTEGYLFYYFYGIIYYLISKVTTLSFLEYAKFIPAFFGSLITIPIYYIGKELFDRKTGLIAAFFFAVSPAVLFRTSAGFFEKEPIGGLFMFTAVWFILRALRRNSLLDSLIAGMSLLYASIMWGGTSSIYLVLLGFFGIYILTGKYKKSLWKTYTGVIVMIFILSLVYHRYSFNTTIIQAMFGLYIILSLIELYKIKYNQTQEQMQIKIPVFMSIGGLLLLISSLFSSTVAHILKGIKNYLFYSKGVIGSTVAENIDATWNDFVVRLGTTYAKADLRPYGIDFITSVSSVWLLSFIGLILITYNTFKNKENQNYLYSTMIGVLTSLLSIYLFLTTQGPGKSRIYTLYVISFIFVTYMITKENYKNGLIVAFFYATILAFFTKVRIIFITGPFAIIVGAYTLSKLIDIVKNFNQNKAKLAIKYLAYIFIVLTITSNALAGHGHVLSKQLRPSFGGGWPEAMEFLKTNTSEDSVILSWWDFGYWFQSKGERTTLLDGGNQLGERNVEAARYFTGYYNETEQLEYLKRWHPTHILVDASMIGKYAAMSKIANDGKKIDSYLQMRLAKTLDKGNATILDYKLGNVYDLYVPVNTNNGKIAGKIILSDNIRGASVVIENLCQDKIIKLVEENDAFPGCVIISQNIALLASEEIKNSPFNRMYIMDLYDLDYLNKVFDNGEIKIFEINYTKIDETLSKMIE